MANDAQRWLAHPAFRGFGERCADLVAEFPAVVASPGELLLREGAPARGVFVLLDGIVRLSREASGGAALTIKLLKAPNTGGYLEVLHGLPMTVTVAALTPVRVAWIPGARFIAMLDGEPSFCRAMLSNVSEAFLVATRTERQAVTSLRGRAANLLLSYAQFFGVADPQGLRIEHPLTQQDVATGLGVTRRSVASIMGDWQYEGTISRRKGRLVVRNVDRLAAQAAGVHDSICHQLGAPLSHLFREPRDARTSVTIETGSGTMPGRHVEFGDQLLVGRAGPCDLLLPDEHVCPQHCRFFLASTGGRHWIEDLASVNGTFLNGKRVERAVLRDGDEIQVGGTRLRFRTDSQA